MSPVFLPSARVRLTPIPLQGLPVAVPTGAGSFHDAAAQHWFDDGPRLFTTSPLAACEAVDEGRAAWAVLAVLNQVVGTLPAHWDLLNQFRLEVHDSLWLPVQQALLVQPGTQLADVRAVVSHPAALGQCQQTIGSQGWDAQEASDTAAAAALVAAAGNPALAAIGPAGLAALHGLTVLLPDLSDLPDNRTRFLLLASSRNRVGGSL